MSYRLICQMPVICKKKKVLRKRPDSLKLLICWLIGSYICLYQFKLFNSYPPKKKSTREESNHLKILKFSKIFGEITFGFQWAHTGSNHLEAN